MIIGVTTLILINLSFAVPLLPVTLVLDWFINPNHAPILVAQQQGFYRQQGLKLTIISPTSASDGPKLVATGKADIAIDYQPQLLIQIQQGLPLIQVGTLINQPLSCVVSLNIKSLNALKGKAIAYSSGGGLSDVILKTMLHTHGLTLDQTKLVDVNYNLVQALASKRVSAATGMMRNFEVIELHQLGFKPHVFLPEKNGFPMYDELIFVARYHHVNSKIIKKFLIATKEGISYLHRHPHQGWQYFSQHYPEDDDALNKTAWFKTIPYFSDNPTNFSKTQYRKLVQFLLQNDLLLKDIPSHRYHYSEL
jgi:putative hydroxymethylpyrimidine transport system substrate-binding protein